MLFWNFLNLLRGSDNTQMPPIFFGSTVHRQKKVTKLKRKRTYSERKKLLTLAAAALGFFLLTLLCGVLGCIYTLYVHDRIFDWVVYTTAAVAVLALLSALALAVTSILKKKM